MSFQDAKIEELESFITECGETYEANQAKIKELQEGTLLLKKKIADDAEKGKHLVRIYII